MKNIQIGIGQIDPSAKPDSIPDSKDKRNFINMLDLKFDDIKDKKIQTCGHNQGILDGTQIHLPNDAEKYQWGFISNYTSNDIGIFEKPPVIDIFFTFNHKCPGISFAMVEVIKNVKITWYDGAENIIVSNIYTVSKEIRQNILYGYIEQEVYNFRRIKIEFISTEIRNRNIYITAIDYGIGKDIPTQDIDRVNIIEEIDPISDKITINTLSFNIKTNDPQFSIVSGLGNNMLMRNQQITITADKEYYGTFFLQFPWYDVYGDGKEIEFTAIDAIGVLDMYKFYGDVYVDEPIENILNKIFSICFPSKNIFYILDPIFNSIKINGLIKYGTCREALQNICFSIGAVVDTSRKDYVHIYKLSNLLKENLTEDKIFLKSTYSPTDFYSGVELVAYEYEQSLENKEVYKSNLQSGKHTILFQNPVTNISINTGIIQELSSNHIVVILALQTELIITGNEYIASKTVYSVTREVPAGEIENIKIFDNCTLVTPNSAKELANTIFDYYKNRISIKQDILLNDLKTGDYVQISTNGKPVMGYIESLNINLNSNKAEVLIVGDVENADYG